MGPPDSDWVSRVPSYSGYPYAGNDFRVRGFHALWPNFPDRSADDFHTMSGSYNPGKQAPRFVLFRFRSPLPAESQLISSPADTEMFHFSACRLPFVFYSERDSRPDAGWVAPFGNPRIKSCRQSPGIFAVNCALRRHTMPRHPSCARIRLIGNARSRLGIRCNSLLPKTMLFSKNIRLPEEAVQNTRPSREILSDFARQLSNGGGRDWNRTSDLVLIRDAL